VRGYTYHMKKNVILFGEEQNNILKLVEEYGFDVVDKNPDFIVSYGGDGTVMRSEAEYPGIPKIILRNSRVCKLCSPLENIEVLKKIKLGKYKVEDYWKLESLTHGKKLLAINDIIVHNIDPRHAIRYKLTINERVVGHEIIGDGVVIATPFGSTGYYRSITDSFFEVGIGLAFNNSTERYDHMILKEDSKIELEITRGPVVIFADNQDDKIILEIGDKILITKSVEIARMVKV
jgi:NAD+ kinase